MIRDVTSKTTGGIGPVRYVEDGKTVNIPIGYVVEGGKTVLVFKNTDDEIQIPEGDIVYLYNGGVTADICGEWITSTEMPAAKCTVIHNSDSITVKQTEDMESGLKYGVIRTTKQIDFWEYDTINVEYSCETAGLDELSAVWFASSVENYINGGVNSVCGLNETEMENGHYLFSISGYLSTEEGNLWLRSDFYNNIVGQTLNIHKIWIEKNSASDNWYLYYKGKTRDGFGGFYYEGDSSFTVTEESDHWAIRWPAGASASGVITVEQLPDLSAYEILSVAYEYVNASTGEAITDSDICFYMSNSSGKTELFRNSSSRYIEGVTQYIQFEPNGTSSYSFDVILKIYSIRVAK